MRATIKDVAEKAGVSADVIAAIEAAKLVCFARLEDRARYYTDLVGIFDELEIPWQQWFMVMDAEGNVIPEYRSAFKLGEP